MVRRLFMLVLTPVQEALEGHEAYLRREARSVHRFCWTCPFRFLVHLESKTTYAIEAASATYTLYLLLFPGLVHS